MKKEIWKDVSNYEGIYQVSNNGIVRSLNREGRILTQTKNGKGYPFVYLWKNNSRVMRTVHRLVAKAFIPNPENKYTVNHKNFKKSDNRLENLEWMTMKENILHAVEGGRYGKHLIGRTGKDNPVSRAVSSYDKNNNKLNTYESITEAGVKTNTHISNIQLVCAGVRKTAGGLIWRYEN